MTNLLLYQLMPALKATIYENTNLKSVHFGPVNARVHGKVFSLSYHAIVMFEQLILFLKGTISRQCLS